MQAPTSEFTQKIEQYDIVLVFDKFGGTLVSRIFRPVYSTKPPKPPAVRGIVHEAEPLLKLNSLPDHPVMSR